MWRAKSDIVVWLAPGSGVVATAGGQQPDVLRLFDGSVAVLRQDLPESVGGLRVLLSNRYLRCARLPWSDSLLTPAAREFYLSARWRQIFGDAGADWALGCEPGAYEQAAMLVAIPKALQQELLQLGVARGVPVMVQPLIAAAWARYQPQLPPHCLFATLESGLLAVAEVREGEIQAVSTHRVLGDWVQAVTAVRRRLCLQDNSLAGLGPLHVLKLSDDTSMTSPEAADVCRLESPANAVTDSLLRLAAGMDRCARFNLLPGAVLPGRIERAALIAAGLLLAVALAWRLLPGPQAQAHMQAQVAEPRAESSHPLDAKERQKLSREVIAVNRAVRELNLPADAVFAALSPGAQKDVALLGMDITNASEGRVRVNAVATSLAGMESYLKALEQRPDLSRISLVHHEAADTGDWRYRFTVEAIWQH